MAGYNRRSFLKVSGAVLGGVAAGSTVTAAESTDRFIVDTKKLRGRGLEKSGLEVVHDLSEVDLAVVEGAKSDVKSLGVDYAPDTAYELDLPVDAKPVSDTDDTSDEPYYPLQWDKQAQNLPEVHDITRGEGARVAVIDTGVAAGHPDLQHAVNEDLSRDFTGDGYGAAGPYGGYHGTHVAGIIASNDRNNAGVVGTAPGAEVVDCRVFSPSELASFADIVAAMVYSASIGCDAANLSLGAYPVSRKAIGSFYGKVLNRTTTYANKQGTLLVTAAGNDGADLQHDGPVISLPNESAQAMSISATGPIGFRWGEEGLEKPTHAPARYTNYGTNAVDLAAAGGNYDPDFPEGWYYDLVYNSIAIPQFTDDGTYIGATYTYSWVAGTSMAAPQVTAAAALVKSVDPKANANQIESTLERTAEVPDGYDKAYYGSGVLNPLAAVEDAK